MAPLAPSSGPGAYPPLLPFEEQYVLEHPEEYKNLPELVALAEDLNKMAQLIEDNRSILEEDEDFEEYAKEQMQLLHEIFVKAAIDGREPDATKAGAILKKVSARTGRIVKAHGAIWAPPIFKNRTIKDSIKYLQEETGGTRQHLGKILEGLLDVQAVTTPAPDSADAKKKGATDATPGKTMAA